MTEALVNPAHDPGRAAEWAPHGDLKNDETLYFLHIPKTAGRSVAAMLSEHFALGEIFGCDTLPQILARPPSEMNRWRLFCGHFGNYFATVLGRDATTITFLRDPIARSISHYRDLKRREDSWLYEWVNTHTFDEFVLDDEVSPELVNLQARYLGLEDIEEDYFGYTRDRLADPVALRQKYSDPELLGRALRRIDSAAFVGIQERFEESLRLLAATFGWRPPERIPRKNTSQIPFDASTISDEAMERLHEITRLDQELYRVALSRFDRAMQIAVPEHCEGLYAEAMQRRPRLTSVRLGFGEGFEGHGWYGREVRNDGVVCRWTGPEASASIDLPLHPAAPLRLRFMAGAHAVDVTGGVRVRVNGLDASLRSWPVGGGPSAKRVFDVVMTPEMLGRQPAYTRIEISVPRTVVPADEIPKSTDTRCLGLYFHWLEVLPVE